MQELCAGPGNGKAATMQAGQESNLLSRSSLLSELRSGNGSARDVAAVPEIPRRQLIGLHVSSAIVVLQVHITNS